jgi:hypothetical protein
VEVIIIRFNQKELEEKCIESVKKYMPRKSRLTIYDNYPENINLGKLWNQLIGNSKQKVICLLNSDTLVEKDWGRMAEVLEDKKVGAVGSITDNCGTEQKSLGRGAPVETNDLSGFCYLFRKEVWKEVGGFPEIFYGNDSIFDRKLQDRGYKLMVDCRVFIHHEGGASSNEEEKRELAEIGKWQYYDWVNLNKEFKKTGVKRLAIAGGGQGNPFPLHRGMEQAINDFYGDNGLVVLGSEDNRRVLDEFKPDFYLTTQTKVDESWETAKYLKERGIKTALYFNDLRSPKGEGIYNIKLPKMSEYFDKVFICAKDKVNEWDCGANHLSQATIQHGTPCKGSEYHVVHIGDLRTEYHTERKKLLEDINFTNINAIDRDERMKISKRSWGIYGSSDFSLSVSHDVEGYTSDRLYNIMGAGGCAVAFNPGGIDLKNVLWWRTKEELKDILKNTSQERIEEIKKGAFKEVQQNHLYRNRLLTILQ